MADHVTHFVPNPIQDAFIQSRAKADLFSSRVGEGKSAALAWSAFFHANHNPGAQWALIRDTFENIQRSTQKEFFKWFPPGVYGTYHHTRKEFRWASGICEGGSVTFIGLEDAQDASKLLSWTLAGIGMDEPAPAVGSAGIDEMIFDLGMQRLRQEDMKWYSMKLATNNPDEDHWTYAKFGDPATRLPGFRLHQPIAPENASNLPEGYYEGIRSSLAHRPDLVRRFVDGKFGFQQEGRAVTPQWNDDVHLANGLSPIRGRDLFLGWDFGHNPTCIITQVAPSGHWLILDSFVGDGIGVEELIEGLVAPVLSDRYKGHRLRHIGDPTGTTGEQASTLRSAVRSIQSMLGGSWRPGPVRWPERRDPLQAVLSRMVDGRGIMQVDRNRAREVWHALRGGWHYHVARTGLISALPRKNMASHPGDAIGYLAAILFPTGKRSMANRLILPTGSASYFGSKSRWRIGPEPGSGPPRDGQVLPE